MSLPVLVPLSRVSGGGKGAKKAGKRRRRWSLLLLAIGCVCAGLIVTQVRMILISHQQQQKQTGELDGGDVTIINDHKPNNSTTSDSSSSFGCLLVMDDNHRLVEWLAYHYYTMNLRYLIVAVDPRSTTSPLPILERWKPLGLRYEIWGDDDYMGNRVFDKRQRLSELKRKQLTMVHRVRQKAFYQFCLEKLDTLPAGSKANKWTLMIDVDEFYVLQKDKAESPQQHQQIMSTPSGLYNFIQRQAQAQAQAPEEQFASPCVVIPRLLFGVKEATETFTGQQSSSLLNSNHNQIYLDTTRWFYHAYCSDFDRNGLAKPLLDLSRIQLPKPHFPHPVNPHRPFQDLCRDPKKIYDIQQTAVLEVHHYLSTWETYSYRNDSRKGGERSREAWQFRAGYEGNQVGPNTDILPWLEGFVHYFGVQQATQLLQGAGVPPSTHNNNNKDEPSWNFEAEIKQDYLNPNKPQQYQSNYGKFLQKQQQQQQQQQ